MNYFLNSEFFLNCWSGEDVDDIQSSEALQFDFETIRDATDNFSDANKLGEGGFGSVYKVKYINRTYQSHIKQTINYKFLVIDIF